jgi:hypothetical protein
MLVGVNRITLPAAAALFDKYSGVTLLNPRQRILPIHALDVDNLEYLF